MTAKMISRFGKERKVQANHRRGPLESKDEPTILFKKAVRATLRLAGYRPALKLETGANLFSIGYRVLDNRATHLNHIPETCRVAFHNHHDTSKNQSELQKERRDMAAGYKAALEKGGFFVKYSDLGASKEHLIVSKGQE